MCTGMGGKENVGPRIFISQVVMLTEKGYLVLIFLFNHIRL